MSWETLVWAKAQRTGSVGAKAILMALAEYADERHSCYPGQDTLAWATEQSPSTVYRHLKSLEKMNFITREHRPGEGGGRATDRYVLLVEMATGQIDDMPEATGQIDDMGGEGNRSTDTGGNRSLVTDRTPGTPGDIFTTPSGPPRSVDDLPTVDAVRMRRATYPPIFEAAWLAYPPNRRVEKRAAYKAWRTRVTEAVKQGIPIERRIGALQTAAANYATECAARNRDADHIKHPATFWGPSDPWRDYVRRPAADDAATAGVPSWATGQRAG